MMTSPESAETVVLTTEDAELLSACSLVLSAVHISHTTGRRDRAFVIMVSIDDEADARHHLSAYLSENVDWPPRRELKDAAGSAIEPPTLFVMGALALFYGVTGPWSRHSTWFLNGAGDSSAILHQGEIYRLVTSLTLHADLTHLLGNFFLGGFLLHFFCRTTGPGLGLFTVLLSAVVGNGVNVLLHGEGHRFVGFSTAVFSTIGMLSMISFHLRRNVPKHQLFVPFMAGAALLAMTGSTGERTDLGAHFFGLLSGFIIGHLLIRVSFHRRHSASLQLALFLVTLFVIYFSWHLALEQVY